MCRGLDPKDAEAASPIMKEARVMLQRWEDGDDRGRGLVENHERMGVRRLRRHL